MKKKGKAMSVWLLLVVLTSSAYIFVELELSWQRLLPAVLAGVTWNHCAYAFDRGMWPRQFVELDGYGKGHPVAREILFWATACVYLLLLAMVAWAN